MNGRPGWFGGGSVTHHHHARRWGRSGPSAEEVLVAEAEPGEAPPAWAPAVVSPVLVAVPPAWRAVMGSLAAGSPVGA